MVMDGRWPVPRVLCPLSGLWGEGGSVGVSGSVPMGCGVCVAVLVEAAGVPGGGGVCGGAAGAGVMEGGWAAWMGMEMLWWACVLKMAV